LSALAIDPDIPNLDAGAGSALGRLQKIMAYEGEFSGELTESELADLGARVVEDWHRDQDGNSEWREKTQAALNAAAQEKPVQKNTPWPNASNVKYPLLTISGLQFAARAMPAIIRGDEAILIRTFGKDPTGEKKKRAKRVGDYLNYKLFYDIDDWESDTDILLTQLPAAGVGWRKVYYDHLNRKCCVSFIAPLRLTVPVDARSLQSAPRVTHDFDSYPHEIAELQAAGIYRDVVLIPEGADGDDQALRVLLEQHRLIDFDGDGLPEPYVVTVDEKTTQVLRIEPAFDPDAVTYADDQSVKRIKRWMPFVKYSFLRDPKGRFYDIGFGHLMAPIMGVVDTLINQLVDAGARAAAGGGFVGSEVRLQGAGSRSGVIQLRPGDWKTVQASGQDLRTGIFPLDYPQPSPILFQLLGMMLEAAKDVASVNDAITGDQNRNQPVGTTLALIEQGQQVFNAIFKRVYRSLREEFRLIFDLVALYGDPEEYATFDDEPEADEQPKTEPAGLLGQIPVKPPTAEEIFAADFEDEDLDIRPVSDPSAVTKMQQVSKAQAVLQMIPMGTIDPMAATKRALHEMGIDDADELLIKGPDQASMEALKVKLAEAEAKINELKSKTMLNTAKAAEIGQRGESGILEAEQAAIKAAAMLDTVKAAAAAASAITPQEETV
jgi:chaperonin GroES